MFKILDEACKPTKGSKYSAAIDLYARQDVIVGAGKTAKVPLGVCLEYDKFPIYLKNNLNKFYLQLEPRSSLRAKGLIAGTGIIDIDYKDEIMIILHNPIKIKRERTEPLVNGQTRHTKDFYVKKDSYKINKGDKIAQIILCEHKSYLMGVDTQEERIGGFGSTGK